MSLRSSSSTPQILRKAAKSLLATSGRLATMAAMAGSKRSLLAQLQRQTFGEVARADARRLEGLDQGDGLFDPLRRDAEPFGDFLRAFAQIAGLVDGVDHGEADHPLDRIAGRDRQLLVQEIRQTCSGWRHRLRYWAPRHWSIAAAGPRPGGIGKPQASSLCCSAAGESSRSPSKAFSTSVPRLSARPSRRGRELRRCSSRPRRDRRQESAGASPASGSLAASIPVGAGSGPSSARSSKRIALKLFLDKGRQLGAGILQQLDRLQQLRRHRQRLALAQQHFGD